MQQIASIFYSIMFLKKDQIEPEHAQVYRVKWFIQVNYIEIKLNQRSDQ